MWHRHGEARTRYAVYPGSTPGSSTEAKRR